MKDEAKRRVSVGSMIMAGDHSQPQRTKPLGKWKEQEDYSLSNGACDVWPGEKWGLDRKA